MQKSNDINLQKNSEEAILDRYVKDISVFSPLTDEEEENLSKAILAGSQKAKDKLVNANLRFVVSIARQYATEGVSILDLIDEGNIAMIKAAGKFDATKGKRFTQYAVWDIRRAIESYLPAEIPAMNRNISEHLPNDKTIKEGANESKTQGQDINERIHLLPEREKLVLESYYGIGTSQLTMQEIAFKYNLRRERVRQIRNRALRRLHSYRNLNK